MERNEKKTEDEDIWVKKKEEKQANEMNKKEEKEEATEEKEEEDEEDGVDEVEMDRLMALEYHQKAQVSDLKFILLGITPM